jgi:hypothetical protein
MIKSISLIFIWNSEKMGLESLNVIINLSGCSLLAVKKDAF